MSMAREVKVGAFVLLGLIVIGAVIFLIGDERQLFESKEDFKTVFDDVQGLKRGSPVRMGGVDIGSVTNVAYTDDPNDPRLYVKISIVEAESRRIRVDSVATIDNKGLLGDKMVTISIGSTNAPRVEPGGTIKSEAAKDFSEMLTKLGQIGDKSEKVLINLEKTTAALSDEKFTRDLKDSVHSLSSILKQVDEGDGYVGKLLRDPAEADKLSRTLSNLEQTTRELNRTTSNANQILDRVRQGPGFAHEIVYGDGPNKALAQFGQAAEEVSVTLRGVREGNGIAHSVIYGDEGSQQVMQNLNEMSKDLRVIVRDMRRGKGTIGALLVDPSIYEDIKMVLGNVERNKTLRALVRYSITRDEKVRGVVVRDGKVLPAPSPPDGKPEPEIEAAEGAGSKGAGRTEP